jgi:hypothetical protein
MQKRNDETPSRDIEARELFLQSAHHMDRMCALAIPPEAKAFYFEQAQRFRWLAAGGA